MRSATDGVSLHLPWAAVHSESDFPWLGRLALRGVARMRPATIEKLLFGPARVCLPLQAALQRLLGGPSAVHLSFLGGPLDGFRLECLTSERVFFLASIYERAYRDRIEPLICPGEVVYDIGAHAGLMSLFFSARTGPRGAVFAFEPSPNNFVRLCRNLALNPNCVVRPVNLGLSDSERTAPLSENGTMSALASGGVPATAGMSQVHLVRLDDFVYRDGHPAPAFVKIDVEGHAGPSLAGMALLLSRRRPRLGCELHSPAEERDVAGKLRQFSYRIEDPGGAYPRHVVALPD